MSSRRSSALRLVHNVVDDSTALWDRRVPHPIERGTRCFAFSHPWNDDHVARLELVELEQRIKSVSAVVDQILGVRRLS